MGWEDLNSVDLIEKTVTSSLCRQIHTIRQKKESFYNRDKSFIISNTNNDDLHIQNLCSNYSVSHICSLKQNVNTYSKKSPFFKRQLLFRRDQNSISILQPTISADEMSSALFSNSCQKIQMTVECRIPVRNDFVYSVGNSLFFISCCFFVDRRREIQGRRLPRRV